MLLPQTPFRWPREWKGLPRQELLAASGIDCVLEEGDPAPAGITIVKGEWPGVRIARAGTAVESGPTGVPWVDSNGWLVQLTAALHPGTDVWIDAPPQEQPRSYLM